MATAISLTLQIGIVAWMIGCWLAFREKKARPEDSEG